ncbi:hypothetical protein DB346_00835 [Verrucomicrobia bacterium LW23]|nr:hypothetical protein DB346_00835 [Verrucomicrobia bacterium LW23]
MHMLELMDGKPVISYTTGEIVMKQGDKTGKLFVLKTGAVEVVKNGSIISTVTETGAVFGELAALLDIYHTATVRAVEDSTLYVVDDAEDFLRSNPEVTFEVARKVALRFVEMQSFLFTHLTI